MITKIQQQIGVSQFRRGLSRYLKQSKRTPVIVTTTRTGEARVLIDTALYNTLVTAYEHEQDGELLTKLASGERGKRHAWESVKKKHGIPN